MDICQLQFVRPSEEWHKAYDDFAAEVIEAGDGTSIRVYVELGWDAFLARRLLESKGEGLAEGIVQQSVFWLIDKAGVIHAELRLRHTLTDKLHLEGGHIGYVVRPSSRRRGVGKRVLELGLQEALKIGVRRALLTCDDSNLGSIGVIEANGGKEFLTGVSPSSGNPIRLYWIEVPQ